MPVGYSLARVARLIFFRIIAYATTTSSIGIRLVPRATVLLPSRRPRGFVLLSLLLCAAAGIWAMYSLPVNFDEAYNLQIAKNVATRGVYATATISGDNPFDPAISTGPTVLLPIALLFRLFGVSVEPARFLMVGALVVCLLALLVLVKSLHGWHAAFATVPLFFAAPSIFVYGILVLGEIPGVLLFIAAVLIFDRALSRRSPGLLALAGISCGLAIVTKYQFALAAPALLLATIVAYFRGRLGIRDAVTLLAGAAAVPLAWLISQLLRGGPNLIEAIHSTITAQLSDLAGGGSVLTTVQAQWSASWLWTNPIVLAVGLIYGSYKLRKGGEHIEASLLLLVFSALWMVWWFGGIAQPWARYLLPGYLTTTIFVAALVAEVSRVVPRGLASVRQRPILAIASAVVSVGVVAGYLSSLWPMRDIPIFMAQSRIDRQSQFAAANTIRTLPPDSVLLGYDKWLLPWDLSLLSGRPVGTVATPYIPLNQRLDSTFLVVIGPLEKSLGVDSLILAYLAARAQHLPVGSYDIYRLPTDQQSASKGLGLLNQAYCAVWSNPSFPSSVATGAEFDVVADVENCAELAWPGQDSHPIAISYHWLDATKDTWRFDDNYRLYLRDPVGPRQSKHVEITVTSPKHAGRYYLRLDMVHEAISWFSWQGENYIDLAIVVQ